MLGGKRHSLTIKQDTFAPVLNAALSVPLALVFGVGIQLIVLGIPGDPTPYTISLIGLGLLSSLDLQRGRVRAVLGLAVSFLGFLFLVQQSNISQSPQPLQIWDGSLLLVSLFPSLAVLVAGLFFSGKTRYKIVKANILASIMMGIGLGIGSATRLGVSLSAGSIVVSVLYLSALGFAANVAQMVLLHYLNEFRKTKRLALAMMPTGFFAYNLVSFASFVSSYNINQLYPFLSSFAFLPALALLGIGTGGLGQMTPSAQGATKPRITVAGEPVLRQGRQQTVRIMTESGGQPRSMMEVKATITKPGGKAESLKVSKVSDGQYRVSYHPKGPGSYSVHVSATSKARLTGDQSFSFEVQAPPPHRLPPVSAPPAQSHSIRPPTSPQQSALPEPLGPLKLPKLDSWNPQLWVNQDIHGYKVREHLATGLTGYVLRASFEHGGTEVAIKIPILKPGGGSTALEETMSEATRLLELSEQSKYVVQLRGILVDRLNVQEILKGDAALYLRSPPAIVMEFMKGGAAKTLLEDASYDSLYYSEKWGGIVMLIGSMIATGLETIHKAGFVHLDVKPQNILFNVKPPTTGSEMIGQLQSGGLVPKLADLGSAVKVGGKVNQFTSEYAPGEQVIGSSATPSMDVYALGSTLYTMMAKTPFNSQRLIDAMNTAARNKSAGRGADDLRSTWDSFEPDLTRIEKFPSAMPIMKRMLAKDPQQRPDAGTVASSLRSLRDLKISA